MAYPTSQTIKDLFASETPQVFRGTFTFADSTTLVVDQSNVIMGSMVLDRSCVSGSSLELGSCIASEFSMTLLNDGSLDGKNFEGAEIYAGIGVSDGTTTYYIPLGRFIVDGVPKVRDTVSINALDRMVKFDKTADATLTATWWNSSRTIQQVIHRCCSMCGVTLVTNIASFPNANVTLGAVDAVFTSGVTDITYRQLLSYCVGAMGKCAWMNAEGNLEIGFAEPLDISTSAIAGIAVAGLAIVGNSSGSGTIKQILDESNRYSSDYEDYVIVTTGAFCDKTETDGSGEQYVHKYLIGSDDYAFDLTDNPIVAWNPQTLLANLTGVIGIAYHPISAVTVPYPWLFPLDWVAYKKGDTNLYSIVTGFTFTMNGNNGIKSVGESPQEKSSASVGSVTSLVRSANGALEAKIAKTIAELEETLEEQIDGKVETWCQSTNPATAWTTTELKAQHNGDLWFYTGTSPLTVDRVAIQPSRTYQYSNSTGKWVAYNNPTTSIFDFADGKTTIYYGTPSGTYSNVKTGDYLVDSTTGSTYRWNGSAWAKVTDYATAIATAKTELETAISTATSLITGNSGGYVVIHDSNNDGKPDEILIMDTDDISTATKVWRWNQLGLGYSSNGYSGPYGLAMTANGEIVADYITTGSLSADRISGGEITSSAINVVSDSASKSWFTVSYTLGSNTFNVKVTPAGLRVELNGVLRAYMSNDALDLYDSSGNPTFSASSDTGDVILSGNLTTQNVYAKNENGVNTALQPIMKWTASNITFNEYGCYNTGLVANTYTVLSARTPVGSTNGGAVLTPFVAYGTWWLRATDWINGSAITSSGWTATAYYVKQV